MMSIIVSSRSELSLRNYFQVAWNLETFTLSDALLHEMDAGRERFFQTLENNPHLKVYGVNVHAGDGAGQALDAEAKQDYLRGLGSGVSFGEPLPHRVTRGILFARMSSFIGGHAVVRGVLAKHIASMSSRAKLPPVPAEGNGGSGEIAPLGHLFGHVPSEIDLESKEPMALVNGSPCATALVADSYFRAVGNEKLIENIAALTVDALSSPRSHFSELLEELWADPDEQRALRQIRHLLRDSPNTQEEKQALVSIRILPKVLASYYQAIQLAKEAAATSLRSVNDNPIFHVDSAQVMSNGSYHNHKAIVAIDNVNRIWADLVNLFQAFIQGLYSDRKALPGLDNTGLGILYMPASAWSEEARLEAHPAVLAAPSVGQNDTPSTTFQAWLRSMRIERSLHAQLAMTACMASQSYYLTGRQVPEALRETLDLIRDSIKPSSRRENIGNDLSKLFATLANQVQANAARFVSQNTVSS